MRVSASAFSCDKASMRLTRSLSRKLGRVWRRSDMGRVGNLSRDLFSKTPGSRVRSSCVPKEDRNDKPSGHQNGALATGTAQGQPSVGANLEPAVGSVCEALGFGEKEAANVEARSGLTMQIEHIIRSNKWTQAQAAKHCRVTQPRMSELLCGHIDRFSLDTLAYIAAALGRKVRIDLDAA